MNGNPIRRGRDAAIGQQLRANALLEAGIVRHRRAPDSPRRRTTSRDPLSLTSRAARDAVETQHRAAVRYAARHAYADQRTGARVTDQHGFPLPGMLRRDVAAVHRWAASRRGAGAAALDAQIVREWPGVVADTYLWAATTPLQEDVSNRLAEEAAALAPEVPEDDIEITFDLNDGAAVAAWSARLRRAVAATEPGQFDWETLIDVIGDRGAIALVRAALQAAAAADIVSGTALNLFVLYTDFIIDFTRILRAGATDPVRIAWEEVARFMLADDPVLPEREVFLAALNEAVAAMQDADIAPRWEAWLAAEREAAQAAAAQAI